MMEVPFFPWARLLLIAVPLLFFGGLLALVITLLAIPATRKAGWIMLVSFTGIGMILALFVGLFFSSGTPSTSYPTPVAIEDRAVMHEPMRQQGMRQYPEPPRNIDGFTTLPASQLMSASDTVKHEMAEAPPLAQEEKQPIDKALTAESARLIDALSRVLAKTILEDRTAWEGLMAKATKQMTQPAEKETPVATKPMPQPVEEDPFAVGAHGGIKPAAAPEVVPTPRQKPAWVDKPLNREGSAYFVDAVGDPYATPVECEAALAECVQRKAVAPFVEVFMPEAIGKVHVPAHVLQNFVSDRWIETRNTSQGEMQILHALVKLDGGAQDYIKESYRQTIVSRRLLPLAAYFSLGFVFLTAVWGYLKIDLATGGKHRGILRTAVAIVILSVVAAVVAVAA